MKYKVFYEKMIDNNSENLKRLESEKENLTRENDKLLKQHKSVKTVKIEMKYFIILSHLT